jgi:NDP-sugar pyrophosphorylase family protein
MKAMPMETCKSFCEIFHKVAAPLLTGSAGASKDQLNTSSNSVAQSVKTPYLLRLYIQEGSNPDQPGHFVQWLFKRLDVFALPIRGLWCDIGSHQTLEEANVLFGNLPNG